MVAGGAGCGAVEGVEEDGAEFKESKGEEAEALKNDEVHVEENEIFERAGEDVGD